MSQDKKRKNKSYYVQSKRARHDFHLDAGMKGFLITCNRNESRAVSEAYSIFNEYYELLYGKTTEDEKGEDKVSQEEEDIEAALVKHVDQFKSTSVNERRFQNVDTKTNNCVFIKTTLEQPDKFVSKIFSDSLESGIVKSRMILRLLPVLGTCKASEEIMGKLAGETLSAYFKENNLTDFTYCIIYKVRCNNSINRDLIFSIIGTALKECDVQAKVNLTAPDLVISVDVLQKMCCLSILTDYFKFKKYNLHELNNDICQQQTTPNEENQ